MGFFDTIKTAMQNAFNPYSSQQGDLLNQLTDYLGTDLTQTGETPYLRDLLKGILSGNSPLIQAGKRNIGEARDVALRSVNQKLASSGFRGSGANLISDIFKNEAGALGNLTASAQQGAINQLLGLNQTELGLGSTQAGLTGNLFSSLLSNENTRRAQLLQNQQFQESQPGFFDFLGNALSGGLNVLTAGLL